MDRRNFIKNSTRCVAITALASSASILISRSVKDGVYLLDSSSCTACGGCETNCVLKGSAVKCVNDFEECGYCEYCFGYFVPGTDKIDGDLNQLSKQKKYQVCPVGALIRKRVGEREYEYTIDDKLCIACGKCVKLCAKHGHGTLSLAIREDLCLNCNRCSIMARCPENAIEKVKI